MSQADPGALRPPTTRNPSLDLTNAAKIVGLGGTLLALVTVFLPWWSFTLNLRTLGNAASVLDRPDRNKTLFLRTMNVYLNNAGWYVDLVHVIDLDKIVELADTDEVSREDVTFRSWGWQCGSGIATLVLCFILIGVIAAAFVLARLRPWKWIGWFIMAGIGIPILVFSLIWIIGSPGQNVEPYFTQGVHVGPILLLPGSLMILGGGIVAAVRGSRHFLDRLRIL